MDLLIGIVLYNKSLTDSETLTSLQQINSHKLKVFVWDNSPMAQSTKTINSFEEKFDFFDYYHAKKNESLSKIYNFFANKTLEYNCQRLIILDHDTIVSSEYFDQIEKAPSDIKLFLPLILDKENKIISPGKWHYYKGKRFEKKEQGIFPSKNVLAINSGLVINSFYIQTNRPIFDERLNLYGIDTKFMFDYAEKENELFILDCKLVHDSFWLSIKTRELKEILYRLSNRRKAWRIIFANKPIYFIFTFIYGLYLKIKYTIQYK